MKRWVWLVLMVPAVAIAGDDSGGGINNLFQMFWYNGEGYSISNQVLVWVAGLGVVFVTAVTVGLGVLGLRWVVQQIRAGLR